MVHLRVTCLPRSGTRSLDVVARHMELRAVMIRKNKDKQRTYCIKLRKTRKYK